MFRKKITSKWMDRVLCILEIILITFNLVYFPYELLTSRKKNVAHAASLNWSQTTFNGTDDGTYSNTEDKNSQADVGLIGGSEVPLLSGDGGVNWNKKAPITINDFQSNYQTGITITYDSDMQADFNDIRFYDATSETELPYWIEEKTDSTSATVWFKTGVNNNVEMYYGNTSATSSSDGDSTFELFDNFDSNPSWDVYGGNTWTWNGAGYYDTPNSGTQAGTIVSDLSISDFSAQGKVYFSGVYSGLGLSFRRTGTEWYSAIFRANSSGSLISNLVVYKQNDAGSLISAVGHQGGTLSFAPNTWLWLKVNVVGSSITAFYSTDGSNWTQAVSTTDSSYSTGRIGFGRWDGRTNGKVDEYRVRKYVSTEPSSSVGTEEEAESGYYTSGSYTTDAIGAFVDFYDWGDITFNSTLNGQTLTVDVLRASDDAVLATDVSTGTDLSLVISNNETSIKLKANFSGDGTTTALAHDLEVAYSTGEDATYTINSSDSDAWEYGGASDIDPTSGSWVAANSADKSDISSSDSDRWTTSLVTVDGQYDYQMYRFKVNEDIQAINQLTANWTGYGDIGTGYDTYLNIWNNNSSAWEQLDSDNLSSPDGTLSGAKTSNFNNYIDASDYTYIMTKAKVNAPPTTPQNFNLTEGYDADDNERAQLTWTANADSDFASYKVEISTTSATEGFSTAATITNKATTNWNSPYYGSGDKWFRMKTVDDSSKSSPYTAVLVKSSCPLLFTYNGEKFEFASDFLGASALGYRIGSAYGENMYLPIDNDEYLKIDGDSLKEDNGKLKLNINEMLQEVTYLDKVDLIAVDHPVDYDIYPNEGFNFDNKDLEILTVKDEKAPVKAKDARGVNIIEEIKDTDKVYAPLETIDIDGFAKDHSYEIDLGAIDKDKATLFINGYTQYPDTGEVDNKSDVLKAEERGIKIDLPSLEVVDKDGNWKEVTAFMGMPAGLTKTFAYSLQDKDGKSIFETNDTRIRIKSNQRVYYDKIWTSSDKLDDTKIKTLSPEKADLHYYGFSKFSEKDNKGPGEFEYSNKVEKDYTTVSGYATKYGDVKQLLEKADDKFVIMTSGDETSLEFSAKDLPEVKKGYKRDYLLYAKGYFKAPRPGRAYGDTIGPLPYDDMFGVEGYKMYPYDKIPNPLSFAFIGIKSGREYGFPASFKGFLNTAADYFKRYTGFSKSNHYPNDKEHRQYLKEYNTRYIAPPDSNELKNLNLENVPLLNSKDINNENISTLPEPADMFSPLGLLANGLPEEEVHHSLNTNYVELIVAQATPPDAPTAGTPSALSTTSIKWNFTDNADNEDGFKLQDSSHTVKVEDATENLSFIDESSLSSNTEYIRHVHAFNNAGDSVGSNDMTLYTLSDNPNGATASDDTYTDKINITWSSGGSQSGYRVYRDGDKDSGTQIYDGALTDIDDTITGSHTYYIYSKNGDGELSDGYDVDSGSTITIPDAPTAGTPTALSTTSIRWNFTDNADNETGFRIYDGVTEKKEDETPDLTYIDEGSLSPNTQYTRQVKAYNAAGESSASTDMTKYTLSDPPTLPVATDGTYADKINVSWTGPVTGADHYHVYRDGESGSGLLVHDDSATSFDDSITETHTYYIYSVNADGVENSTYISDSGFTQEPVPIAPTAGTPTVLSTTSIRWNFTDNADNETGFRIYDGVTEKKEDETPDLTYIDEGSLSPNTQYTRQVKAYNDTGDSDPSADMVRYTKIESPTGASFDTVTDNSITISAPGTVSNLTADLSGIYCENTTNSTNSGWLQTNSWTSSTLDPNTEYGFRAKTRNGDGVENNFIAGAAKYTLAEVPGESILDAGSTSSINVIIDNGSNPAATTYAIYEGSTGQFAQTDGSLGLAEDWQTFAAWGGVSGIDVTGLLTNNSYAFKVKARNAENVETVLSTLASKATLALSPDISADKSINTWYAATTITTINNQGFGSGSLEYYNYLINTSDTYVFIGSESTWDASTKVFNLNTTDNYYIHVKAYNAGDVSSGEQTIGPFTIDATNPTTPGALSVSTPTQDTTPTFSWGASTDAHSGLSGYYIKIGSRSGGSDIVSNTWKGNTNSYTAPRLDPGTYYLSVKAKDNVGNMSPYKVKSVVVEEELEPDTSTPSTDTSDDSSTSTAQSKSNKKTSSKGKTKTHNIDSSISKETRNNASITVPFKDTCLMLSPDKDGEVKVTTHLENLTISVHLGDAKSAKVVFNGKTYTLKDSGDNDYTGTLDIPNKSGKYKVVVEVIARDGTKDKIDLMFVLVDPNGYVIDNVNNNRIANAKVTLYKVNGVKKDKWQAEQYDQVNPQETSNNGEYAFMVPSGKYKLHIEAPGYNEFNSKLIKVDEGTPVTLNIGLNRLGIIYQQSPWKYAAIILVLIIIALISTQLILGIRVKKN